MKMMNRTWTAVGLLAVLDAGAVADEQRRGLTDLPERKISLSVIDSMAATNLLEFVAYRSGLRLDLAPEIKTNSVSLRFKFDNANCADVIGMALHFLNAHATINADTLQIAAGQPPNLPRCQPIGASPLLSQPFARTNSWTHRLDQTVEYVLHVAGQKNFVMGPDCSVFQKKVVLAPNGRKTAEVLEDICAQAGVECTLRGSVVFIQKREDNGPPNEASQDTSLRADPER
jgi:hypothetical protein